MENNEKKDRDFGRKVMWLINVGLVTAAFYAVLFGPTQNFNKGSEMWLIYAGLLSIGTLFVDGMITWTDVKGIIPFAKK